MYSVFLVEWSAAFPREQTLVLRLEDYRADLPRCLRAVLRFLRLPRPPTARWRRMVVQPPRNRGSDAAALLLFGSSSHASTKPFNQRLAWLMGDRRFPRPTRLGGTPRPFASLARLCELGSSWPFGLLKLVATQHGRRSTGRGSARGRRTCGGGGVDAVRLGGDGARAVSPRSTAHSGAHDRKNRECNDYGPALDGSCSGLVSARTIA